MRVLLVQPPRCYWPYTSEGDNFLLQQALPALAAVARAEGHEVKVIDCMPLHIGWRSLYHEVRDFKPHVIGCGENHALYATEALRFFELCKQAAPEAVTVAGGGHFTNLAHDMPTIQHRRHLYWRRRNHSNICAPLNLKTTIGKTSTASLWQRWENGENQTRGTDQESDDLPKPA